MKFEIYDDINKYIDETMDIFMQYEIQNNLLIGNCLRGKERADIKDWFMAAVKDKNGCICLAGLMTPPFNIVLYECNNAKNDEALNIFINETVKLKIQIPGILAEKSIAERFSEKYASTAGIKKSTGKKMRIYKLEKVNNIHYSTGKFRCADKKELYYLPYWNMAFNADCGFGLTDISNALNKVKNTVDKKNLYIWEDNIPVSQAAIGKKHLIVLL